MCAHCSNWSAKPLKPLVLWCNYQLIESAACMPAAAIGLPLRCNPEMIYSATRVKGYNTRFGRPVVAVSTQMCVAEYVISRLHPRVKGLQGFGALLRGHIVKARASCRIDQSRIAPAGQGLQMLLWAHTHVCCSAVADQMLL